MTMNGGSKMIHHRKVSFPVNTCNAKEIVEIKTGSGAKLLGERFPILRFKVYSKPFPSFFESCIGNEFGNFYFEFFVCHSKLSPLRDLSWYAHLFFNLLSRHSA